MKVKDLIDEIERCKKEYPDFLEWEVYTEQLEQSDKVYKRKPTSKGGQGWEYIKPHGGYPDDWEYFRCCGFWTKFTDKKIFTINVNY
jgi:hypothetical protein